MAANHDLYVSVWISYGFSSKFIRLPMIVSWFLINIVFLMAYHQNSYVAVRMSYGFPSKFIRCPMHFLWFPIKIKTL
jgi:hypothetical protein